MQTCLQTQVSKTLLDNGDLVAGLYIAAFDDPGENTLNGHDACTDFFEYLTPVMARFTYLGNF